MAAGEKNDRDAQESGASRPFMANDPERLAANFARAIEEAGKAAKAWVRPTEAGQTPDPTAEIFADMVTTLSKLTEYWTSESSRALEAQTRLFASYMDIWTASIRRIDGEPASGEIVAPDPGDKRFDDPDWSRNPFFAFLKQAYLVTARWAAELAKDADGLDTQTRQKAQFYVRQFTEALSPSNFVLTNPALLRETLASDGENLVRGMRMLAEDISADGGSLRLRQSDNTDFKLGRNIANTPGKVVARSDLAEIIQYEPATESVLKRPLIIVPPWINKYYILDLAAERSFIRWAVEQGHTVFAISWVNPDERHRSMGWDAYVSQGIGLGLDTIMERTDERQVNAIGYCVGGTLLAAALARMAQERDDRIASATFFAAQVDFTHAGDLRVFADAEQIERLEKSMSGRGFLEGSHMSAAFNMLRARDLIWPYVVNSYLRGRNPPPFDILFWNGDTTRVTAANHSYYLRNCYLENNLARGRAILNGKRISLSDIKIPVYNLAAMDDHIAPARSVLRGSHLFGGPVDFVLAGSGHIAGVVNPPTLGKYRHWTRAGLKDSLEEWLSGAREEPGSWWPNWQRWIERQDDTRVPARKPCPKKGFLADAPGNYVMIRHNL
ncbi:class I poly(R)-hydroxyalkanoic acid synthase [Chelativorans sp. Marseille-P2723]|uniref:PHA/PHB synthase family protein n=1 Tax=Chelativorans sp. Marseille-P2723 TaxID=2709133 RepID=UPI001570DC04|nr:class I poly(R)-hydroxyalkanoic acid synthase [Chelativorans sp. Marseille-P2723]